MDFDCCPDGSALTWAPNVDLSWSFSDETGSPEESRLMADFVSEMRCCPQLVSLLEFLVLMAEFY